MSRIRIHDMVDHPTHEFIICSSKTVQPVGSRHVVGAVDARAGNKPLHPPIGFRRYFPSSMERPRNFGRSGAQGGTGLVGPPSKILPIPALHTSRPLGTGSGSKDRSEPSPSTTPLNTETGQEPAQPNLECLTGPQRRCWAVPNSLSPIKPTGPLPPQPVFRPSTNMSNAVASGSRLPRPIETLESDSVDPFLFDGNPIEVGPVTKKRRAVPAEANRMHTEVLQYLENLGASRDTIATTSSDHMTESTPRDAELQRLREEVRLLQAQNAVLHEEKRSNLASEHNLERQLVVEAATSKSARESLLVAAQAFINVLRVTTPKGSSATIYRGDPSRQVLRDLHITIPRNTRTDLSQTRREAYQPLIDITTDLTVTGREESQSLILFVCSQ